MSIIFNIDAQLTYLIDGLVEIINKLPESYIEPILIRYLDFIIKMDNLNTELPGLDITDTLKDKLLQFINKRGGGNIFDFYRNLRHHSQYLLSSEEERQLINILLYLIMGGIEINWALAEENLHQIKINYLNALE